MRERKLQRLQNYDYTREGAYFITTIVKDREHVFGKIDNGQMLLNEYGRIVEQQWKWLFGHYDYMKIDEFCVMPDHFHGIIWIVDPEFSVGNGRDRSLRKPIPQLVGAFKTTSSKLIHQSGNEHFRWQKSYHDRIIRHEKELYSIREYIKNNPKMAVNPP